MSDERILIIDDEPDMVDNLTRILRREGYRCLTATDPLKGLELLDAHRPDLVLTDLKMPAMDGMEVLRRARLADATVPVIVITAFQTIESAVAAIKGGAFDYLPKNFTVEHLKVTVDRALRQRRLAVENRNLREQLQTTFRFESLLGRSPAMARVFELVRKAARSDANILVQGESGTGKELIARALHANSPRAAQPFMPVDCASLPEQLLESELFGHERGAFTGAVKTKPGLIEAADKGTLFLDEIGEMPLGLQAKLLRALQERQIRRVGDTGLVDVDVRVVSATNRDLRAACARNEFREDLFFRINVIAIELPPLRERAGDVRLLAQAFLDRYGKGRVRGIDDDALAALEAYRWPGNVRELQNVIERACALTEGERLGTVDLPDYVLGGGRTVVAAGGPAEGSVDPSKAASQGLPLKDAREQWLAVLEASYLRGLLARHGGNVSAAAKDAGIDRKTFHRLITKHALK